MNFGWIVDTHQGPYGQEPPTGEEAAAFADQLIEEAVEADKFGLDGVFLPERHARTETQWPDPLMALMAMAARTQDIKLATYVLQPALYDPSHLAEQVALIDVVSRGRAILGMGIGYHRDYFSHFGAPFDERVSRFEEALDFLAEAWGGGAFNWEGKNWQRDRVLVTPRPYNGPPPIWIAAMSEPAVNRAGRRGDGLALAALNTPRTELRRAIDQYRQVAQEAGRAPTVAISVTGFVGLDRAHARDTFGPLWVDDIKYYMEHGMLSPTDEVPDVESVSLSKLEHHLVLGGVEEAAEQVRSWISDLDLREEDWFILRSRLPYGPSRQETLSSMERFATGVVPALRD